MRNIKKLGLLMLALVMLLPTFVMAKEYDMKSIEDEIKATIDYSDEELYGTKYSLRSAGVADFAIYHRSEEKLSMADDAFDKDLSKVEDKGDSYEITLWTKPISKKIIKTYYADCTEIKFVLNGKEVPAEPFGSKTAVNNENKSVPKGFKITISKKDLLESEFEDYSYYSRIIFDTNIKDSGVAGKIAALMMNPNARFFIK